MAVTKGWPWRGLTSWNILNFLEIIFRLFKVRLFLINVFCDKKLFVTDGTFSWWMDGLIADCFHGPSGVLLVGPHLVEHSSSLATALITDTRTVQVFAQGIIVCVTERTLVTVFCYFFLFWSVCLLLSLLLFSITLVVKIMRLIRITVGQNFNNV